MDEYIGASGGFFKYPLDANGNPSGPPVPVSAEEAVPNLLDDYENGRLQVALKDGQLAPEAASDRGVAENVIRPVWDQVMDRDAPLPDRLAQLRQIYGDGPKTVRLVTRVLGEDVAEGIWGDKAIRYAQNDQPPDTPVV